MPIFKEAPKPAVKQLKEVPIPVVKQEILSKQAIDFLKKQRTKTATGMKRVYSDKFISYVSIMLTDAANKNRDADMQTMSMSYYHKPQKVGPIPMPKSLDGLTTESPPDRLYKSTAPIMPNIGIYSPSTDFTSKVYEFFATAQGQRFMKNEYNWLVKDPKNGEWMIKKPEEMPKTNLGKLIPKRMK